jgi:hypothetical protein
VKPTARDWALATLIGVGLYLAFEAWALQPF